MALAMATTAAGAGMAAVITFRAWGMDAPFKWHPICMAFSMISLTTASVFLVQSRHGLSVPGRVQRVQAHLVLSDISLIIAGYGMYAIYRTKESMGKPHYTTWHAWAGGAAACLYIANWVIGASKLWDSKKGQLNWHWRSAWHRRVGATAYMAGLVAFIFGLHSAWGVNNLGKDAVWVMTAAVVVMGVAVVFIGAGLKVLNIETLKTS